MTTTTVPGIPINYYGQYPVGQQYPVGEQYPVDEEKYPVDEENYPVDEEYYLAQQQQQKKLLERNLDEAAYEINKEQELEDKEKRYRSLIQRDRKMSPTPATPEEAATPEQPKTAAEMAEMARKAAGAEDFFRYLCKSTPLTCDLYGEDQDGIKVHKMLYASDQELIGKITLFIFYLVLLYGAKSYTDFINKLKSSTSELYIIYKLCKLAFRRMATIIDETKNIFRECSFEELTNESLAEIFLEQIKDLLKIVEKTNIKTGGPGGLVSSFDMGILNKIMEYTAALNFNFSQVIDLYYAILKVYITYQFKQYNYEEGSAEAQQREQRRIKNEGLKTLLEINNERICRRQDNPIPTIIGRYTYWNFAKFKEWIKNPKIDKFIKIIMEEAAAEGTQFNKVQMRLANLLRSAASTVGRTAWSMVKGLGQQMSRKKPAQVAPTGGRGKKTRRKCKKKRKTKKRKIKKNKKTKKN